MRVVIEKEASAMGSKVTLREILDCMGMTPGQLAELANVHPGTVRRALVPGCEFSTNVTSALAIAKALGLAVEDIDWANGLSDKGRPAETGVPLMKGVLTSTVTCIVHFTTLPLSGICDECSP